MNTLMFGARATSQPYLGQHGVAKEGSKPSRNKRCGVNVHNVHHRHALPLLPSVRRFLLLSLRSGAPVFVLRNLFFENLLDVI